MAEVKVPEVKSSLKMKPMGRSLVEPLTHSSMKSPSTEVKSPSTEVKSPQVEVKSPQMEVKSVTEPTEITSLSEDDVCYYKPIQIVKECKSLLCDADVAEKLGYTPFVVGTAKRLVHGSYVHMVDVSGLIASFSKEDVIEASQKRIPLPLLTMETHFDKPNPSFFVIWELMNGLVTSDGLWASLSMEEVIRVWEYACAFDIPLTSDFYLTFIRYAFAILVAEENARNYTIEYVDGKLARRPREAKSSYWVDLDQKFSRNMMVDNHKEKQWLHAQLLDLARDKGLLDWHRYDQLFLDYQDALKKLSGKMKGPAHLAFKFYFQELARIVPSTLTNDFICGRRHRTIPPDYIEIFPVHMDLSKYEAENYVVQLEEATDIKDSSSSEMLKHFSLMGIYKLQQYLYADAAALWRLGLISHRPPLLITQRQVVGLGLASHQPFTLLHQTGTPVVELASPLSDKFPSIKGFFAWFGLPSSSASVTHLWTSENMPESKFRLRFFHRPDPTRVIKPEPVILPSFAAETVPLPPLCKLQPCPIELPPPVHVESNTEDDSDNELLSPTRGSILPLHKNDQNDLKEEDEDDEGDEGEEELEEVIPDEDGEGDEDEGDEEDVDTRSSRILLSIPRILPEPGYNFGLPIPPEST